DPADPVDALDAVSGTAVVEPAAHPAPVEDLTVEPAAPEADEAPAQQPRADEVADQPVVDEAAAEEPTEPANGSSWSAERSEVDTGTPLDAVPAGEPLAGSAGNRYRPSPPELSASDTPAVDSWAVRPAAAADVDLFAEAPAWPDPVGNTGARLAEDVPAGAEPDDRRPADPVGDPPAPAQAVEVDLFAESRPRLDAPAEDDDLGWRRPGGPVTGDAGVVERADR
ncbi:MAG TPA: hypothetical protein VEZ42_04880, partial [Pseudonocardia sp.]|nr:hypothetical protein [Pseudonocardia sp.]